MRWVLEVVLRQLGLQVAVIWPRAALVLAVAGLRGTGQAEPGLGEVVHGLDGEYGGAVELRGGVVFLVDGDRCVHHFGDDGLFVDDGLDKLVDVVVGVFTGHDGEIGAGVGCLVGDGGVLECRRYFSNLALSQVVIVVFELLVFDWDEVVGMNLWTDFLVREGLDGGVVVVLVNFTIDGGCEVLVPCGLDRLLCDCWSYCLGNVCDMAFPGGEFGNGFPGGLHCVPKS